MTKSKDFENQENEGDTAGRKGQAETLLKLVLETGAILFHDQFGRAFIAPKGDGRQVIGLRSKDFRTWLADLGWTELERPINPTVIQTVVTTLEGIAIHKREEIALHLRVASRGGALWYDLGGGSAVKITPKDVEIHPNPPILFRTLPHQRPQAVPVWGGKLEEIFNFLPEPAESHEKILLLAWFVTALMQGFPHPILVVHGEKGSRKTTLFKLLRKLLDPSHLETLQPNGDAREFVQQASHNYFLPLDNLSPINSSFSDVLCRVVTGEGFSKRELYSDDDDVIYSFQRLVGVNGINLVLDKPDVLDRALIIRLSRPKKYVKEKELFRSFEEARPRLVGALFKAIARTMKYSDQVDEVPGLEGYRMADFARLGCAVAKALGMEPGQFVEALKKNLQRQQQEVLDSSPVALAVISLMGDGSPDIWTGTPESLLASLRQSAESIQIDPDKKPFPQNANWLWRRLEEAVPTLRELGIEVSREKGKERIIRIRKIGGSDGDGALLDEAKRVFPAPPS